jgi:hypothetical protein
MALGLMLLASGVVAGCSSGGGGGDEKGVGTLSVPLVSYGASGTKYRLRNATFEINSGYYYYDNYGEGGTGDAPAPITVSSEDDPEANTISVSLERGYYNVRLLPGWHLEKSGDDVIEEVESTLISDATQFVYVNAHSSTNVEYEFGIGGRSIWFNGDLNINIHVYEDPSELYGNGFGGAGPVVGAGGFGGQ